MNYASLISRMKFTEYAQAFGTLWLTDSVTGEISYKPWDFWKGVDGEPGQLDFAAVLEAMRVFWSPKARQKGASEIWSLYSKFVLEKEPKSQAKVFSATKPSAREFLELRFARKVEGHAAVYPDMPGLKWEIGRDRCECENGSFIQVYSSDDSGARGGSQRLTLLDEAREYAASDFANMLQAIFPSLRGRNQLAILSSGKPGSPFNARIKGTNKARGLMKLPSPRSSVWISEDNKTGMVFLNDLLDPEHCVEGWREKTLEMEFGGDLVRMNAEHPLSIDDIFSSHEGKVLANLNEEEHRRHVDGMPFDERGRWNPECDNYFVFDGGNTAAHPTVGGFMCHNRYTDMLYYYDGVFARSDTEQQMSVKGKKIKDKVEYWASRGAPPPTCIADGAIFNDLGVKSVGTELEEITGLLFLRAIKADKDGSTIALAKRVFRNNFAINPALSDEWEQLENWVWDTKKDAAIEREDDCADVCRYCDNYIRSGLKPIPLTPLERMIREARAKESRSARAVVTPPVVIQSGFGGIGLETMRQLDGAGVWNP